MSGFHVGYIHNLYPDKQESIHDIFCQFIKPLIKDIDPPELIQEWKKILILLLILKVKRRIKSSIQEEII